MIAAAKEQQLIQELAHHRQLYGSCTSGKPMDTPFWEGCQSQPTHGQELRQHQEQSNVDIIAGHRPSISGKCS